MNEGNKKIPYTNSKGTVKLCRVTIKKSNSWNRLI